MAERDEAYEAWIAGRREVAAQSNLVQRVMRRVEALDASPRTGHVRSLIASPRLRIAVSVVALAVGVSRFVYFAAVTRLIPF